MKRTVKIFAILSILIALVEIILCFWGPLAFIQKPSLVIFPLLTVPGEFSSEEIKLVERYLEEEFAKTGSFAIISKNLVNDYLLKANPDAKRLEERTFEFFQAKKLAQSLGLSRFALGTLFRSDENGLELSFALWNAQTGEEIKRLKLGSPDVGRFLQGKGIGEADLELARKFTIETKGITMSDLIILALFIAMGTVGVLALVRGMIPNGLLELIWAAALLFFIFAFLYAQNANMDYVQRFIASRGQIHLAQSTALEQFYALVRFAPLLILYGWLYVSLRVKRDTRREHALPPNRLVPIVGRWALPWVLVSAVLYAFAFPSSLFLGGVPLLAWGALVPLLLVLLSTPPLRGMFYVVLWGVLQALIINFWHSTYKYTALFMLSATMFIQYLCFGLVLVLVIKLSAKWGFISVPLAWVAFDFIRSLGFLAYPWGMAGTSQYGFIPLIQIAQVFGVWGISFVVVLANSALAYTIAARESGWRYFPSGRPSGPGGSAGTTFFGRLSGFFLDWRARFPLYVGVAVLIVSVAYGIVSMALYDSEAGSLASDKKASLLLVQQNTDPRKHDYKLSYERLASLTDRALEKMSRRPDLIVWSEGAFMIHIPYWSQPEKKGQYWADFVNGFLKYQKKLDTWLLTGTEDFRILETEERTDAGQKEPAKDKTPPRGFVDDKTSGIAGKEQADISILPMEYYNSTFLLDPDGGIADRYYKMHLVPFTEYFPLDKQVFGWLYAMLEKFDISNWTPGTRRTVFQHPRFRFITPICFEDVFSDDIRRFILEDVDVIVNVSNDYWSLSPVEGRQHGLNALFRTVENRRPMVRATSSGYTVAIDAVGRIQPGSPEPYTQGFQIVEVPLVSKIFTLYTLWGDWFPFFAMIAGSAIMGAVWLDLRLRRRKNRN